MRISLVLFFVFGAALSGCGDDRAGAASQANGQAPPNTTATPPPLLPLARLPEMANGAGRTIPVGPSVPQAAQPAAIVENAVPDANGNYVGVADVVEGDVIRFGRTRIMLYGIDTVEPPQVCSIAGRPWECSPATIRQLQTIVAEGQVTCAPVGTPDFFGRILALCDVNGASVNARMVRSGFALVWQDEMPEYLPLQEEARREGIGLWQGTFQAPQEYRESVGNSVRRP